MRPISLFIPGLEGGGAQRVFVNLANSLVEIIDSPIHLIVIREGGVFRDELRPEVEVINLGTGRVSRSIMSLARYLRTHRPRVFVSTMNYCNVVAILAWRLAGRPCRMVVREASVVRDGNRLMRFLMRWSYPQADCVVALSPEVRLSLLRAGIPVADRIVEIGNPGVFQDLDAVASRPCFLIQPMPRFICAVGSLRRAKGFDILLSAFARLSDTSLHLVILGEGPLRKELEVQVCELGVEGRVHMPGFVKHPIDVIRQAELFVLSSRWEGFPNVLLEALSTGVPIVAADCDGAPRSMLENGSHGHLVTTEDSVALAEGIEAALKSPMGTPEGRRSRAEDFSADSIARKYLEEAFIVKP
jgi:glycosyltransferase involved in cell wall biosynthesis